MMAGDGGLGALAEAALGAGVGAAGAAGRALEAGLRGAGARSCGAGQPPPGEAAALLQGGAAGCWAAGELCERWAAAQEAAGAAGAQAPPAAGLPGLLLHRLREAGAGPPWLSGKLTSALCALLVLAAPAPAASPSAAATANALGFLRGLGAPGAPAVEPALLGVARALVARLVALARPAGGGGGGVAVGRGAHRGAPPAPAARRGVVAREVLAQALVLAAEGAAVALSAAVAAGDAVAAAAAADLLGEAVRGVAEGGREAGPAAEAAAGSAARALPELARLAGSEVESARNCLADLAASRGGLGAAAGGPSSLPAQVASVLAWMLRDAVDRGSSEGACTAAELATLLFRAHAGALVDRPGGYADALLEHIVALLELPQCPPTAAAAALEAVAAACEGSVRLSTAEPDIPRRAAAAGVVFLFLGQAAGAAALAGLDASPGSDSGAFGGRAGEEELGSAADEDLGRGERSERDAFRACVLTSLAAFARALPLSVAAGVLLPAARWGLTHSAGTGEDRGSALHVLAVVAGEMGGEAATGSGPAGPREALPPELITEVVGFAVAEAERPGASGAAFAVLPPALAAILGSGAAEAPAVCERVAEACVAAAANNNFVGPTATAAAAAGAMALGALSEEGLQRAAGGPAVAAVLSDPARVVACSAGEAARAAGRCAPGVSIVTALALAALLPARRPVRVPGAPVDKAAIEAAAAERCRQLLGGCLAQLSATLQFLAAAGAQVGPPSESTPPGLREGVEASQGVLVLLSALLDSTAGEAPLVRRALSSSGVAEAVRGAATALKALARRPQFKSLAVAAARMLGAALESGDCPDGPELAEALVHVAGSGDAPSAVRAAAAAAALGALRGAALRPGRAAAPLARIALTAAGAQWAREGLPAALQPAACALALDAARCRSRDVLASPEALQAAAAALDRAAALVSEPWRSGAGEARRLLGALEALFTQAKNLVQRPELAEATGALGGALVDCAVRELSPGTEDEIATVLWACAGQNGGLEALLADYAERRLGVSWSRLSAGLSTHLVGSAQGQAACREALFLFANEAACACAEGRAA